MRKRFASAAPPAGSTTISKNVVTYNLSGNIGSKPSDGASGVDDTVVPNP